MYGLDLDDWLCHERDWRTLAELLDELRTGSRYFAALYEDMELAALSSTGSYRKPEPADAPSFREFDAHRYDNARICSLLEQLIAVTAGADGSDIEPFVPIPAIEKYVREQGQSRLVSTIAKALGEV